MRVEVEHSPSYVKISWWPYKTDSGPVLSFSSWMVIKDLDTTVKTLPLPVEQAIIAPGTTPGVHTNARRAREYADILIQAARMAELLDEGITKREHFAAVRIYEWPKDDIRIEWYGTEDDRRIEIAIPDQSEYRAARYQRSGGLMGPIVEAANG